VESRDWKSEFERRGWPGQREYQLSAELSEIRPRIWRRLVVADATPLPLLHRIFQISFGWHDYHLHEFRVGALRFGVPDEEFPPPHIDEQGIRLYQLAYQPGDRFLYTYDFGDSWDHEVVLEELRAVEEPQGPKCTDGERAAPPEDCGGATGYERLVAALGDPEDEEHDEYRQWAGRWQPDRLNLEAINRRLSRLPRGRRKHQDT